VSEPRHNHPLDSLCLINECPRGAWRAAVASRDAELAAAVKGKMHTWSTNGGRMYHVRPRPPLTSGGTPGERRVTDCRGNLDPDAHEWVQVRRNGLLVSVYCERCDVTPLGILEVSPLLSAEPPDEHAYCDHLVFPQCSQTRA